MSQKLCELEALVCEREAMIALNKHREMQGHSLAYDDGDFFNLAHKFRQLSCHHEEEKKGCEACNPGASLRVELRGSFSWSNLDPKFCPNCGRKL